VAEEIKNSNSPSIERNGSHNSYKKKVRKKKEKKKKAFGFVNFYIS
jgi:hypothetical protein